jgi:cell division protein FtsW (lipid II flippase)
MAYLIGVVLALAVSLFARFVGLDRDRAFYPTVMIVIAGLYGLFAVLGGAPAELAGEWVAMGGFILLATVGFKLSLWLVVAALFGHGVFDFFHGHLIANPGVPAWWPAFCGTYDVTAAGCLAWLLWKDRSAGQER